MNKSLKLAGLEDINIVERPNELVATISLYDTTWNKLGLVTLADQLNRLVQNGFTTFATDYDLGYYDDVENIKIEAYKFL